MSLANCCVTNAEVDKKIQLAVNNVTDINDKILDSIDALSEKVDDITTGLVTIDALKVKSLDADTITSGDITSSGKGTFLTLTVNGGSTVRGILTFDLAEGDELVLNTLTTSDLTADKTETKTITVSDTLTAANGAITELNAGDGALSVSPTSVSITQRTNIDEDLSVNGNTSVNGTVTAANFVATDSAEVNTFAGDVTMLSDATVEGTLTVNNLVVNGTTTDSSSSTSTLTVQSTSVSTDLLLAIATETQTLNVTGKSTLSTVTASALTSDSITATGPSTFLAIKATDIAADTLTMDALNVSATVAKAPKGLNVGSGVSITDEDISLTGGVSADGDISCDNLTVNTTLNTDELEVGGSASVAGDLTVKNLTVTGTTTGILVEEQTVTIPDDLTVKTIQADSATINAVEAETITSTGTTITPKLSVTDSFTADTTKVLSLKPLYIGSGVSIEDPNIDIMGDFSADGSISGNNITADNLLKTSDLKVTGDASISGTLAVGNLAVSGNTTGISVTKTVTQTLDTTTGLTIGGALDADTNLIDAALGILTELDTNGNQLSAILSSGSGVVATPSLVRIFASLESITTDEIPATDVDQTVTIYGRGAVNIKGDNISLESDSVSVSGTLYASIVIPSYNEALLPTYKTGQLVIQDGTLGVIIDSKLVLLAQQ